MQRDDPDTKHEAQASCAPVTQETGADAQPRRDESCAEEAGPELMPRNPSGYQVRDEYEGHEMVHSTRDSEIEMHLRQHPCVLGGQT